jgi:hypothetical protein
VSPSLELNDLGSLARLASVKVADRELKILAQATPPHRRNRQFGSVAPATDEHQRVAPLDWLQLASIDKHCRQFATPSFPLRKAQWRIKSRLVNGLGGIFSVTGAVTFAGAA